MIGTLACLLKIADYGHSYGLKISIGFFGFFYFFIFGGNNFGYNYSSVIFAVYVMISFCSKSVSNKFVSSFDSSFKISLGIV